MPALETPELLAESFLTISASSGLGSPQGIRRVLLSHRKSEGCLATCRPGPKSACHPKAASSIVSIPVLNLYNPRSFGVFQSLAPTQIPDSMRNQNE